MKNTFYRLLVLILSLSLFLSCVSFTAMAEKGSGYIPKGAFGDDFETGETENAKPTNWALNTSAGSVRIVTEDDNNFMRITRGADDESTGKSYFRPQVNSKKAMSFPFKNGSERLIIETKFRVSSVDYRYMLRVNMPGNEYSEAKDNSYYNVLFYTTGNTLYFLDKKYNAGSPRYDLTADFAADTWYAVKIVMDLDDKTVRYYLNGTEIGSNSGVIAQTDGWKDIENITQLGFTMGFPSVGGAWAYDTTAAATMDIDDVKIYRVLTEPTATLITENGTLPANNRIGVDFDKYMDVDSLNSDTVKLFDSEGNEIECSTREYDEENSIYYITADELLTPGDEYTVKLANSIYADNTDDFYEQGLLIGTKEFTFTATNAKSSNAKLATLMLDGVEIRNFDPSVLDYEIEIPYVDKDNIPLVTVETEDANPKSVEITQVEELPGVATVKIVAENEITELTYTVNMKLGRDLSKIGINLLTNPGFETGDSTGWYVSNPNFSFRIKYKDAAEGDYCGVIENRTSATSQYTQKIPVEAGKTYLLAAKVRLSSSEKNGTKFDIFAVGEGCERPENTNGASTNLEMVPVSAEAWHQIYSVVVTTKDTEISPTALCWSANIDYMIDDHFLGELKPTVKYTGKREIDVPVSGTSTLALTASITNQLGTSNGVKNESIDRWEIVGNPYGVSISGDELIVRNDADPGEIEIEAVMIPKYVGAYTDELREKVTISLNSNGNKKPQAKELKINGAVELNNTLEVAYRYYQEQGKEEGATEIKWYAADSPEGPFKSIPDAYEKTFTIDENYVDKVIKVGVLPISEDGEEGKLTYSSVVSKPKAPVASNVKIKGDSYVGAKLEGIYTYSDINSDEENLDALDGTKYAWLRSETKDGEYTPISGATESTYTVTEDDIDCFIKFSVTPVAVNGPNPGATEVSSSYIVGPTIPSVSNVTITHKGNSLYAGSYKYSHANGIVEGKSICKWYLNDEYVCDGTTFNKNVTKGDVIKFEVTPIAAYAPFEGSSSSATLKVASKPNLGGGGGGGGGSVAGSAILPVIPVEPEEEKPADPTTPVPSQPQKHWAADAIEFVTSRGIMENVSEGDFGVNNLVSRKDFLKYVLTGLGFEGTPYRGEFSDISETDEIAPLLQTAVNEGIISKDTLFNPERSVSREEVCKIVMLALEKKAELTAGEEALKFGDNDAISAWAVPYVTQAVNTGIFKGVSETEFAPRGQVTRAQTATLVQRIVNYAKLG